jgi:hypothetical protein
VIMAIQQLDLGAVYNTLAQQRALGLQEQQVGQQGALNALQMARYQRENDLADKKQSILSGLNKPDLDAAGKQSILAQAYPELLAQQLFREQDYGRSEDGTVWDKHTGKTLSTVSALDGETAPQATPQAASRPTLAPGGHGPVPMPVQREELPAPRSYSEGVKSVENTTGNPNAQNPRSTATGDGQFTEGTWLDMMSRKAPSLTQGKSREEILAMRGNPEISAKMTEEYALDNQRTLEQNGIQATPALLYSAHHFGAGAAVKFAKASPDTPLTAILSPEAIAANPHLADLTVGQARANQERRFADVAMPGQPPQQQPQQTAAAPAQAPQSGDEGFSRVRSLKALGLPDAPTGMQWVGRRRPDGSIETKVAPMPGAPDDRASKQASETFDQETKLRTEHQKLVGGFEIAQTNYATMPELAADDTGGSDIALVNAFFKTFAPLSNVQEGEFSQAAKTAGVSDRVINLLDRALTGQVLTPTQRQEMITAAGRFYNQQKSAVEGANEKYTKLAQSYPGVNAERVVINPIRDLPKYEPKPKAETAPKAETRADMPDARKADDGKWYVTDPARPGKYLEVQ